MELTNTLGIFGIAVFILAGIVFSAITLLTIFILIRNGRSKTTTTIVSLAFVAVLLLLFVVLLFRAINLLS